MHVECHIYHTLTTIGKSVSGFILSATYYPLLPIFSFFFGASLYYIHNGYNIRCEKSLYYVRLKHNSEEKETKNPFSLYICIYIHTYNRFVKMGATNEHFPFLLLVVCGDICTFLLRLDVIHIPY